MLGVLLGVCNVANRTCPNGGGACGTDDVVRAEPDSRAARQRHLRHGILCMILENHSLT
jgi:hypothetical protein